MQKGGGAGIDQRQTREFNLNANRGEEQLTRSSSGMFSCLSCVVFCCALRGRGEVWRVLLEPAPLPLPLPLPPQDPSTKRVFLTQKFPSSSNQFDCWLASSFTIIWESRDDFHTRDFFFLFAACWLFSARPGILRLHDQ